MLPPLLEASWEVKNSWIALSSLFMVSQSHKDDRVDQYEMERCICVIQRNQSTLSSMCVSALTENLITGPDAMNVKVYRPMPKSVSNSSKKKEKAEKGLLRPTTKPDVDNYVTGCERCSEPSYL